MHILCVLSSQNGTGDSNDVFRLDMAGFPVGAPLRTVRSTFSLIHVNSRCALHSHNKQLPKWLVFNSSNK